MKRLLANLTLLLLGLSQSAWAMPPVTLSMALPYSDTAYLVRVTSFDNGKVTFAVTDTLMGDPLKVITLGRRDINLKLDDEMVICSSKATREGQDGNMVGGVMEGNIGWIFAPVMRDGSEIYVSNMELENGKWVFDKEVNNTTYFTLAHIKQFIKEHPEKH